MSPAIRLVISDIDGTLVRPDKSLGEPVIAAVGRLQAAGVTFSLISARPPSGILPIAKTLGLTGLFGAFNGGTIFDAHGAIRSAVQLGSEAAELTLESLTRAGVEPWVFADGRWYARTTEGAHVQSERIAAGTDPIIGADFPPLLGRIDKIVGVSDDEASLTRLEGELSSRLGEDAKVSRSQTYYLDITAPGADKGAGVERLAKAMEVSLAEVAVIGDQHNDVAMFARAGMSIAMGQGPQDVRDAADHVTRSNAEDGVAFAIDDPILSTLKS